MTEMRAIYDTYGPPASDALGNAPILALRAELEDDVNLLSVIRRHPVATYFAGVGHQVARHSNDRYAHRYSRALSRHCPAVAAGLPGMIAGRSISSIVLTGIADGREGYRKLVSRLVRFRVDLRWYGALLIGPALLVAILSLLSLISPEFLPSIITAGDRQVVLAFALASGLAAGTFEELWWSCLSRPTPAVPAWGRRRALELAVSD